MDRRFPPPPAEPSQTAGTLARSAAVAAGSALVGALVGAALIGAIDRLGLLRLVGKLSAGEMLLLALLLAPGVFMVVLVHELGHLLGGRLAGWRPAGRLAAGWSAGGR